MISTFPLKPAPLSHNPYLNITTHSISFFHVLFPYLWVRQLSYQVLVTLFSNCLLNLCHASPIFPSFLTLSSSVQFMSCSLRPHRLQHARLPCQSPKLGACSDSCPSSRWCRPNISSCHPLFFPPSIFNSIRVFSNESTLYIKWTKY